VVVLFVALAASVALFARAMRPDKKLPVLGRVPPFTLVDQANQPFALGSLAGKVWVADFIFTYCKASCPRLTARMHHLQERLALRGDVDKVRLVSFSVDPEADTPEVLAEYAKSHGADVRGWSFVTGPSDAVQAVVVQGFKVAAVREERDAGAHDVTHGNWFVLGDRAGNIRGYYSVDTDADVDSLAADIARLERE
jgi:cytochrome oxidase Cu insertion factor (SCO1/SenC/PrrC family)